MKLNERKERAYTVQRLRRKISNMLWEFRLGVTTRGIVDMLSSPDAYYYSTMPYSAIMPILECLELTRDDVFIDIGCGKGRVICCAARHDVREVVGVDKSKEMCVIAAANAARLRHRLSPVTVVNCTAQEFDYSEGTAFFLFNPFDEAITRVVLAQIERTLSVKPRALRFAYANPSHESVFGENRWLEKYDFWDVHDRNRSIYVPVSFWRSKPK